MPKGKGKRHPPEQIVAILSRAESGETVAAVCRETNISAASFHRWKSQYGGMDLSELQQLRGLREENARLKRLVADQALHIQVLKEVNGKNGEPGAETPGGVRAGRPAATSGSDARRGTTRRCRPRHGRCNWSEQS